ncbi:MAG: 4-hydroxybutyrate CoA-transferase, partial [Bacteroidetes bacterium]|nr:4-hydroxybutyrate CoA-transferase [Bacteroidota bacterium]
MKIVSAEEAVKVIKSNDNIYLHSAVATPERLIDAMVARHAELENVNLYHMHIEGKAAFTNPLYQKNFKDHALFVSNNVRKAVQ